MDKHRRVPVAKRPLGVSIIIEGGLKGYSGCISEYNGDNRSCPAAGLKCQKKEVLTGNLSFPMYQPLA